MISELHLTVCTDTRLNRADTLLQANAAENIRKGRPLGGIPSG